MGNKKTLFIIGKVWPEPNSSAAGTRMMQIIDLFQKEEWKIIFSSAAAESEYAENLGRSGIESVSMKINDSSFDAYINELQPEIVLFDRFTTEEQFGWRIAEFSPNSMRILDTVDLHSLRLARQQALKENRKFKIHDISKTDASKREIASIYRCDLSLMISEAEMNILADVFSIPDNLLYYLPFLIEIENTDYDRGKLLSYDEKQDFITIGNFLHPPNWDSVMYLKNEIWPIIRKQLPDTRLHVYGAYPSQKVFQMHNEKEGFMIHGRADSAKKVVQQARVLLAPLRFGAGLKGKLLDSMIWGTPSVTTNTGSEGMKWNGLWNGTVAAGKKDIADAAITLYSDRKRWTLAQKNGFQIIEQRFSRDIFASAFMKRILNTMEELEIRRESNFVGQMLMHHTISGTKYMARWIEEKNRA